MPSTDGRGGPGEPRTAAACRLVRESVARPVVASVRSSGRAGPAATTTSPMPSPIPATMPSAIPAPIPATEAIGKQRTRRHGRRDLHERPGRAEQQRGERGQALHVCDDAHALLRVFFGARAGSGRGLALDVNRDAVLSRGRGSGSQLKRRHRIGERSRRDTRIDQLGRVEGLYLHVHLLDEEHGERPQVRQVAARDDRGDRHAVHRPDEINQVLEFGRDLRHEQISIEQLGARASPPR